MKQKFKHYYLLTLIFVLKYFTGLLLKVNFLLDGYLLIKNPFQRVTSGLIWLLCYYAFQKITLYNKINVLTLDNASEEGLMRYIF